MVQLRRLIAGALCLGLTACMAGPPAFAARVTCGPRDVMVPFLTEQLKRLPRGAGITSDGLGFVERYQDEEGNFTIMITDRNKMSCVLLEGGVWIELPPEVPSEEQS